MIGMFTTPTSANTPLARSPRRRSSIDVRNNITPAYWNSKSNSEIIREYASHGTLLKNITEVSVLQAIRPFLEDYIRARFPGRFQPLVMLDAMIGAVEGVGAADPLFPYVADLRALNEYTRPNMHGGGQAPNPDALRAQCNRVIGIIGTY